MKIVFVTRPKTGTLTDALRATVKNGKAVRLPWPASGSYNTNLAREGLRLHQIKSGKFFLAWCENGTRAKKGAR